MFSWSPPLSNTPADEQSGKASRLPGGRLTYERGIRYSSLPAPSRHLALTLATWADVETGIIPARFQPAKGVLEEATGLSRGAIVKHLNLLEEQGWISRETGGGAGKRTKFRLLIPAGAKTGHQVTPSAPENGSPHDPFAENGSPGEQKTGHLVNKNGSPGDPKSPLNPYESLSLVDEPQRPAVATTTPNGEREKISPTDEPATPIVDAYLAAAGRPVSTATRTKLHQQAAQLLADGFPAWWLADRARELAARGWTDLAQHCDRSTVPTVRKATDTKTGWCGQCDDPNYRQIRDPARDHELVDCPACNPAALARARRATQQGEAA